MDITFSCAKCSQHIAVDEAGAGKLVDCPKCGESITVPKISVPSLKKNLVPSDPPPGKQDSAVPSTRQIRADGSRLHTLILLALLAAGVFFIIQWSQQSAAEQKCLQSIDARLSVLEKGQSKRWYYSTDEAVRHADPNYPNCPQDKMFPLLNRLIQLRDTGHEIISIQRVGTTDSFDIFYRKELQANTP